MYSLIKTLFKISLIGGLVIFVLAGSSLILAGSDRSEAILHDVRDKIGQAIDANLDDPAALRRELTQLGREYPARISKVRKDLAGLRCDINQLERDHGISSRVVELADEDLAQLHPNLDGPGTANAHLAAFGTADRAYPARGVARRVLQIQQTRAAHLSRARDANQQLSLLRQQEAQFVDVLHKLEGDQAKLRTQLDQLNLQVDSIQRNERLIQLLDRRKRTLEECRTYDLQTLDQMTGKLTQILTEQSVELEMLTVLEHGQDYEEEARHQLHDQGLVPTGFHLEQGQALAPSREL